MAAIFETHEIAESAIDELAGSVQAHGVKFTIEASP